LKSLIEPAITTAAEKIASLLAPTNDTPEPADGASLQRVIETDSNNNNDISPRVSEVRGRYNVGTSLIKYWEGIPYVILAKSPATRVVAIKSNTIMTTKKSSPIER
jgi:hypothetical protein